MNSSHLPDDKLSSLIVTIFRANGALIAAGDDLVADLRLTSSRWQVLGTVAQSPMPLAVASIARNIGLTRQGVRAIVKELIEADMVRLEVNPHHRRSQLVVLTPLGEQVSAEALTRQRPWAQSLFRDISPARIADATDLLHRLMERLAAGRNEGTGS
ncbi:hypothetical protein HMP09_0464 [Sphingomonas sp. HMP9]|uniref:MarR family winged helix-turn-helix transcriptional regulator n=1 Tax=Sphingomonas sp. HMP9 TaxID=1517554 RepID=UPI001596DAFA|nr:MarR family winged helix-turn-helix transcriptional regulator [Sphingomonas sp. HMP9]BCA61230.1 hypothetical protein HMP09_0464 [Sphingomonas sp. HMP9]